MITCLSLCKTCDDPCIRHHGAGEGACNTFRVAPVTMDDSGFGFSHGVNFRGDELVPCDCAGYIPSDNLEYVAWYQEKFK